MTIAEAHLGDKERRARQEDTLAPKELGINTDRWREREEGEEQGNYREMKRERESG